jgi:hypothetical protein
MSRAGYDIGKIVTKKLMTEMQAQIAFASYDSPSIAQRGDSISEKTMDETISALYLVAMTQRSSANLTSSSMAFTGSQICSQVIT